MLSVFSKSGHIVLNVCFKRINLLYYVLGQRLVIITITYNMIIFYLKVRITTFKDP